MKRFAVCALCALILISSLAACGNPTAEPTSSPEASPAASEAPLVEYDWDAAYARYAPDTVVMTVNGDDVTWDEFFYWLYMDYVTNAYGNALDVTSSNGVTLGRLLALDAEGYCIQYHVIDQQAEANNVALTEDDQAVLDEQLQSDIESSVGEDGTEEEFYEYLAERFVTPELYDFVNRIVVLYPRIFMSLYGENGENVTDEEALAFAEEYNFVTAKHILFRTSDNSGEALSDEEKAAKRSEAQAVLDELNAVPEAERAALFDELMKDKSEDPGLTVYPNGYCYEGGAGVMVSEFDDAVLSLQPGEISGIVESSSGYHIIMREEVTPEDYVMLGTSQPYTLRYAAAVADFDGVFSDWLSSSDVSYAEGFEEFDANSLFE